MDANLTHSLPRARTLGTPWQERMARRFDRCRRLIPQLGSRTAILTISFKPQVHNHAFTQVTRLPCQRVFAQRIVTRPQVFAHHPMQNPIVTLSRRHIATEPPVFKHQAEHRRVPRPIVLLRHLHPATNPISQTRFCFVTSSLRHGLASQGLTCVDGIIGTWRIATT